MFGLFKPKQAPQAVNVSLAMPRPDYRIESAYRNMGMQIARCNGAMGLIKRNHNSVSHPDFMQLQVMRDYMRRLLGHV